MTPKRVGLIGWPVSHSLSPAMHNAAFTALGMTDWNYDTIPIPPDIIRHSLNTLRGEGGYVGINVTVPHKQAVIPHVRMDEKARAIGAVNTITFRDLSATNTDVDGFMDDLAAHDVTVVGKQVLVLGAGGAARAAVYGLALAGAQVMVVNRTMQRAQEMVANLTVSAGLANVHVLTLDEAAEREIDVIVNSTSAGMVPHVDGSPWLDAVPFPHGVTVYDMVYRPAVTNLMRTAEAHGGRAIGGLGMLVRQGAAAFKIWTGVEPPIDIMFDAAQRGLQEAE